MSKPGRFVLLFKDSNCLFAGLVGNLKVFRSINRVGISHYKTPDVSKCFRMFNLVKKQLKRATNVL